MTIRTILTIRTIPTMKRILPLALLALVLAAPSARAATTTLQFLVDLHGQTFAVRTAHAGGVNVPPGTHTATQLEATGFAEFTDGADGAGGTLRVLGSATGLIVK